jgi:5'-3' exonuclease
MYQKSSCFESLTTPEDLALGIANMIDNMFKSFPNVLLLNDGNKKISPMKCSTLLGRKRKREEAQQSADIQTEKLVEAKTEEELKVIEESIEKKARVARGVSFELSSEVLRILREDRGYKTLQCEGEADAVLIQLSRFFTYVVSEDSDLLIGGVNNLLRGIKTQNLLYSASDILKQLNAFNLQQFEIYTAFKTAQLTKPKPTKRRKLEKDTNQTPEKADPEKPAKRQKLENDTNQKTEPKQKRTKNPKPCSYYPLEQKHLQEVAVLTGCDYSEGVKTVGFKTGMEILMQHKGNCADVVTAINQNPGKYGACPDLLEIITAGSALFAPKVVEKFDLDTFTQTEDFYEMLA